MPHLCNPARSPVPKSCGVKRCRPVGILRLRGRGGEQREHPGQKRQDGKREEETAGAGAPRCKRQAAGNLAEGAGWCETQLGPLAAGPLGRWPLGRWAAGPLGRWAAGPLGRWAAGPLAAGPLGRWAAGPLGRWAAGPLGYYTIPAGTILARLSSGFSPRPRRQGGFLARCVPVSALFPLRCL